MSLRFECLHKVSVVSAILPAASAAPVIEELFGAGERNAFMSHARGTLLREHWTQRFLSPLSPEKQILRFLVPDDQVDTVMRQIVDRGGLRYPGAGAVFAVPCDTLYHTPAFPIWAGVESEDDISVNASIALRENLAAISCIVEAEQTAAISRAAMQAGAHGPIVSYCEGRGLRDRLGWLRITKRATKEWLSLIVDNADAEAVMDAIRNAGRLDMPGRGFLYRMPVQKGIVNLASTTGASRHAADLPQIIAALDELMGHSDWRRRPVVQLSGGARAAGIGWDDTAPETDEYQRLTFIVTADHAAELLDAALAAGAGGANLSQTRLVEADSERALGRRLNRERTWIQTVVPAPRAEAVMQAVLHHAADADMDEGCFFAQPVRQVVTYRARSPSAAARSPRMYRGAPIRD